MAKGLKVLLVGTIITAVSSLYAVDYTLVKDGKPASCIVLSDNAGPVERHAASELSLFLEKSTGAKINIENAPSKDLYNIYLGTTEAKNMPKSGDIEKAVSELKDDGFVLAADKDGVRVISKKPVGVLYGAYEILKKYADIRWFAPGAENEYCPKRTTISVPDQVTASNPSLNIRRLWFVCANTSSKTIDTWDWMVRNNITIQMGKEVYRMYPAELEKRGTVIFDGGGAFCLLFSDDLFDKYPEYFGLINGKRMKQEYLRQPCTTNPEVAKIMVESLNKWFETPPKSLSYLVGNNDSYDWCQCENCVKIDPPEEKLKRFVATRYYTFVNKVAEEVYKKHPDADIWAYAYQNFQYPPTGVVPDPRITVQAAIHGRCYRHSMADPQCQVNEKFRDILAQWGKLKNPITTIEYTDTTCLPNYLPIEKAFADDIKYYKKTGLTGTNIFSIAPDGVFGDTYKPGGKCWEMGMRGLEDQMPSEWQTYYIAAKMLWDVNSDYDKIYEDIGSKYYGKTWPVMSQYRALLTKSFVETSGHVLGHGGTPSYIGKCLEKPGVEARLLQLLDEAEKTVADDNLVLKRIKQDRRYFQTYWQVPHEKFLSKLQKEINVNKRTEKIAIDGKSSEKDWGKADFVTNFVDSDGKTAANPQTFVKMLYDEDNLYLTIEAMEPEPGKMKFNVKERDGALWEDCDLEIFIAAPGMNGKYAHIAVNPAGAVYDALSISPNNTDLKFDSGIESETVVLADRWVAEIRIPTVSLGHKVKDGEAWKINVARSRYLTDVKGQFSSWSNGAIHGTEAFRTVVFGGTSLLKNGDFEDVVELDANQKKSSWKFSEGKAPACWIFHPGLTGTASLVDNGAASGLKALRLTGPENYASMFQQIGQPADFRGNLKVNLKARGNGELIVCIYKYDRKTGLGTATKELKSVKVSSNEWTQIGAVYNCEDGSLLNLAFHVKGEIDLDDVSVTLGAKPDAAPVK